MRIFSKLSFFTSVTLFYTSSSLYSQIAKPPVAIYDFTYNPELAYKEYLPSIKQFVTSAFQKSKMFTILNRTSQDALLKEKDLTQGPDYFLNKAIKDGKKVGAKYIITGEVDRVDIEKSQSSQGIVSFSAGFSFLLKFIDPETNVLKASEQISVTAGRGILAGLSKSSESPKAAVDASLGKISKEVENFIFTSFAIEPIKVIEILKEGKDKIEKILIAAGSSYNLKNGTQLELFTPTETEVNGKKMIREKFLGKAKIEKVEDENFSVCKISDGGDLAKEAFDKGQILMCKIIVK
ncbi:MAG: hypothetical protein IPL55_06970 [Saprospiraceae bacterium]|nr:hypothetical protein [Saprospiraceae bacterium]